MIKKKTKEINTEELLINPMKWLDENSNTLTPEVYNTLILYVVKVAGDKISYKDACYQIQEIVKYWREVNEKGKRS